MISNRTLWTHTGRKVRFYDDLVRGRVVTVNLAYTRCTGICPAGFGKLAQLQDALGDALGREVSMYTITLDPVRMAQYTPPLTLNAAYDSLVTLEPNDLVNPKPSLATRWQRTPDGRGWRFTLREGVKYIATTWICFA